MKVDWGEAAIRHIGKVREYLTGQKSLHVDDVIDRIVKRTALLEDLPYLGAKVPEYPDHDLRELIEPPFRILYRVRDDCVDIVAVIHASQKMPRLPRF